MTPTRSRFAALVLAVLAGVAVSSARSIARADDEERPKVLFVPHTTLPFPLRNPIQQALRARADLVSTNTYLARCRRASESAGSHACIRRYGTRLGADAIVVVSWRAWGRSRVIRVTWRAGDDGRVLLSTRHDLPGVRLDVAARRALAREAVMVAGLAVGRAAEAEPSRGRRAARSSGPSSGGGEEQARAPMPADGEPSAAEGGLPPPVDWEGEGEAPADGQEAASRQPEAEAAGSEGEEAPPLGRTGFGFDAGAGLGFGARSSAVPMEAGPARLTTSPFPALSLELGAGYRTASVGVGAQARYFTSIGLRTQELRNDGTTRTVDARTQTLQLGVELQLALGEGPRPTRLGLGVGYHFRLFGTELPLSMPEYTLSGVYARADLSFAVGSGPLRLAIVPEVASVNGVTAQLQEMGKVKAGVAVGGEAAVRFDLLDDLRLEVLYRESHAFLTSDRDTDMTDVERYGMLRATYRP